MTDINLDELIAEARWVADEHEGAEWESDAITMIHRLADALVQVQGSADEWWKQYTREVGRTGAFWAAIYSAQMGADHPVSFEEWMAERDYEDARDRLVNGVRVQREYAEKCEDAFKAQRAKLDEALAVIERAKYRLTHDNPDDIYDDAHVNDALEILNAAPADALRERDAALIESLAEEIVVEAEADLPDDFLRGFDTGADAVYAALREKARERREGVS